jgi:hypothetical protein
LAIMAEIGQTLRETRMRQKIDMTEVEAATKIRAKYLRALENEEWDLLPGPTFVKTFLRTYAEYLGLDARTLVEEYRERYEKPSTQDLTPIAGPGLGGKRNRRRRPAIPVPAVLGVLGVVALLGALYLLGSWGDGDNGGGDESPAPGAVEQPQRQSDGDLAGEQHGDAEARREARERRRARARARARRERRERERRRAAANRTVSLALVPTGEVFVCLVDGRGRRLVPGQNLAPGARRGPYRSRRFRATFGNGQITLRVNGRTVQVAEQAQPIGMEITPKGRRMLSEAQRPTCS